MTRSSEKDCSLADPNISKIYSVRQGHTSIFTANAEWFSSLQERNETDTRREEVGGGGQAAAWWDRPEGEVLSERHRHTGERINHMEIDRWCDLSNYQL